MDKLCAQIEGIAFKIVKPVGSGILLLLVISALLETWYVVPGGDEVPIRSSDSVIGNSLAFLVCILVFLAVEKFQKCWDEKQQKKRIHLLGAVAAMWALGVSMWWILSVDRPPVGDQEYICAAASYFRTGDYTFLNPGSYCHIYPYQLGLIWLIEKLYYLVEPFAYQPIQVLMGFFVAGIVYLGHSITYKISKSMAVTIGYFLFAIGCLPLFLYSSWIYGDIPGIFFSFLGFSLLLSYEECGKKQYLAGIIFAFVMAVLVRQNSMILLVAFALIGIVHFVKKRDVALLVTIVLACLLTSFSYAGIYRSYEERSGIERSSGIPTVVTVAMGMQEHWTGYGWDNNYQKEVYYASGYDVEVMGQMGLDSIRERLTVFFQDPIYAMKFYGWKILSQWNEPLFQSVFFTTDYKEENEPEKGTPAESVSGSNFHRILDLCDILQFVIYVGMLLYFLLGVKKEKGIIVQFLAVVIIGGFLFSILWEGKARYILPYYIFMFPYAAVGYRDFSLICRKKILAFFEKKRYNTQGE